MSFPLKRRRIFAEQMPTNINLRHQFADGLAFGQNGCGASLPVEQGEMVIDTERMVNGCEQVTRLERAIAWFAAVRCC